MLELAMSALQDHRACTFTIACWTGAILLGAALTTPTASMAETLRWQDLFHGVVITQTQCAALPQAVWVSPRGRPFCMRYYLVSAGGQGSKPVVVLGGDAPWASIADREKVPPAQLRFGDVNTDNLLKVADRISKEQGTAAIVLARVGLDGSSGTHNKLRHTRLELLATNEALETIKRRHHFEGFHIYGHSGGGNLVVGLLELRHDIGCDVPADGQLTHPNPHGIRIDHGRSPDPARQGFDVTDDAALIARNRSARILVVTDPEDKIVTIHHQLPFVEKLRQLGRQVELFSVDTGEGDHHGTTPHAALAMRDCIRGMKHDEIVADLAELVAKRLAVAKAKEEKKIQNR